MKGPRLRVGTHCIDAMKVYNPPTYQIVLNLILKEQTISLLAKTSPTLSLLRITLLIKDYNAKTNNVCSLYLRFGDSNGQEPSSSKQTFQVRKARFLFETRASFQICLAVFLCFRPSRSALKMLFSERGLSLSFYVVAEFQSTN